MDLIIQLKKKVEKEHKQIMILRVCSPVKKSNVSKEASYYAQYGPSRRKLMGLYDPE